MTPTALLYWCYWDWKKKERKKNQIKIIKIIYFNQTKLLDSGAEILSCIQRLFMQNGAALIILSIFIIILFWFHSLLPIFFLKIFVIFTWLILNTQPDNNTAGQIFHIGLTNQKHSKFFIIVIVIFFFRSCFHLFIVVSNPSSADLSWHCF